MLYFLHHHLYDTIMIQKVCKPVFPRFKIYVYLHMTPVNSVIYVLTHFANNQLANPGIN